MARFISLFSSSSGNSTYIGNSKHGILIDIGKSAKQIENKLFSFGIDPNTIDAIFITHSHSDHIQGVKVFASRYGTKVYASQGTLDELEQQGCINDKFDAFVVPYEGVDLGDMFIKSFRISHDTKEPCGYSASFSDGRRISVVTDTGVVTDEILRAIRGSDLVLLESNYDEGMLRNGPYTYQHKMRILSESGHLSNNDCAELCKTLVNSGTTRFVLGHISTNNNFPELAFETAKAVFNEIGAVEGVDYILSVAKKDGSDLITL